MLLRIHITTFWGMDFEKAQQRNLLCFSVWEILLAR